MPAAKKLIEVALPLDAINRASAREKSIRHGHPSTLHLWWARRPLAAARAVIFSSLVDDPDDPEALPAFVAACKDLPGDGPNASKQDSPRMRLFDFIERLVTWEATTDEHIMSQARELIRVATEGNPPPLLDPFAGGGSIPLEAQRLGLEAHASDLNPVAVMINKAMIEIPPRFAGRPPVNPDDREDLLATPHPPTWKGAAGLAADVRYYGEWMRERARERIGHLYPNHKGETVIAWLWARTVTCPNPAVKAPVPLVRSFVLSKKKGRECWAKPIVDGKTVRFHVTPGKPTDEFAKGTMGKHLGGGRCLISGEPMSWDYVRAEGKAQRMGSMLMAIVTQGKHGRSYHDPTQQHVAIADSAKPKWRPVGEMQEGNQNVRGRMWGLREFADLFTPRQLTALTTFSDLVADARALATQHALASGLPDDKVPLRDGGAGARAYAEAVSVYLAFAVDKGTDYWSSICSWLSDRDTIRATFARQAIPMVWDFSEANPLSDSTGNLTAHINWISKVLILLPTASSSKSILNDAATISSADVLLSTDPPYYDNIGYADLSDFFYVWMRRNLRDIYPDIFSTMLVPKAGELIASKHRHDSKNAAKQFFESGMKETFTNFRRFVRHDFPVTVYYAFKQQDAGFLNPHPQTPSPIKREGTLAYEPAAVSSPSPRVGNLPPVRRGDRGGTRGRGMGATAASTGWETMLTSLIASGFSITGTWPMRTERGGRMNAIGANALASSIVLVCRPRPADAPATSYRRFRDQLRAQLPPAIKQMKTGSIAPVDLAQATIGPGMAIYSRYRAVLEINGEPVSVRAALSLIDDSLEETLEEGVAGLDAETRFAVGWFEQCGFKAGDFGEANVLAQGKNTAVESAELAGLVESKAGAVRLIHWKEYDPGAYDPRRDDRPTVWEGAHHLIERVHHYGETGAAELYNRLPGDIAEAARDLAYRLYRVCERKGWAEDALDYNGLVGSWSEITRLAASARSSGAQGDLFDG